MFHNNIYKEIRSKVVVQIRNRVNSMVNISKAENDVQLLYELLNSSKGFYDKKKKTSVTFIHRF